MNIHKVETVGFWGVHDKTGRLVAVVYGTSESAETLLTLLLPKGTVTATPARSATGPFAPPSGFGSTVKGLT
jgi:hypothetical protein